MYLFLCTLITAMEPSSLNNDRVGVYPQSNTNMREIHHLEIQDELEVIPARGERARALHNKERAENLDQLKELKGTCLGSFLKCYNGTTACMWHIADPISVTFGKLLIAGSSICGLSIGIVDCQTKVYLAYAGLVSGALGLILINAGKFSGEQERAHLARYLALRDEI